jgi:hypothetical protein
LTAACISRDTVKECHFFILASMPYPRARVNATLGARLAHNGSSRLTVFRCITL